jgi:urocanate hydratase
MWWLYPRAFCYALATTWAFRFVKGVFVFVAHVPEYIEYSIDDFRWASLSEHPNRFLRTIQSEKKKLEEEHLSKKKEE